MERMNLGEMIFGKKDKELIQGKALDDKPLYNFSDKESKHVSKYRFIVLGSYGSKDKKTYNEIKQAIKEMGYKDEVMFVRNNQEILKFGVAKTPALVVDGKVVTYGGHIEGEEVKELFVKYNIK